MEFQITSAKLTGNPGASGWAQVHEFKPDDPQKLKERGILYAVVATKNTQGQGDIVLAGRELINRLHEEYFGKTEASAFNTLKSAVERVIQEFKSSWGDVEIAATVYMGDAVYSVVGGGTQVAIFRNGIFAKILESNKDEATVVSASGYPKEGDMLLLGTKLFFDSLSQGVIKAGLETSSPREAVEMLAPTVHGVVESGSIGAAILRFHKEEEFFQATPVEPKEVPFNFFSFLSSRLPQRKIFVGVDTFPRRRTMVSVGAILLVLLVVSIGFGIRQKMIKEARSKYEPKLTQAQHEFEEALGLINLNPERARELFVSSRSKADEIKDLGVKDSRVSELIKKLEENEGSILGEYKVEPEVYIDLSILSDGFSGEDMSGSGDRAFILDKDGRKIVGIAISTKRSEVVAGPSQIDEAEWIASYEDTVFILNSQGVFEVGEEKVKVIEKDWEGSALPYAYAGNFYILDKGKSVIWRYPASGSTFGSKQNWLGSGVTPDFSNIISWAIDGSVWVLSSTGKILKFTLGSPQALASSGVAPALSNPTAIYTNEELSYLYILDREQKRVVVLNKNGEFKAQYLADKIGEARDLVVSEAEKKMILLSGSKLYSIELKHL